MPLRRTEGALPLTWILLQSKHSSGKRGLKIRTDDRFSAVPCGSVSDILRQSVNSLCFFSNNPKLTEKFQVQNT